MHLHKRSDHVITDDTDAYMTTDNWKSVAQAKRNNNLIMFHNFLCKQARC